MTEEKPKRRFHIKTFTILLLFAAGIYAAFIGPSILKPISPIVVLPGEPTGIIIGGFQITNTILATLLSDLILILIAFFGSRKFAASGKLVPEGLYNAFEALVQYLWETVEGSAGKWAKKIFPIPATIFLLIFVANMIKLFPGFESIGRIQAVHEGKGYAPVQLFKIGNLGVYTLDKNQPREPVILQTSGNEAETTSHNEICDACEIVPFLRGSATDINFPFALAVITVIMTQVFGAWALGLGYFEKYFPVRDLVSGSPFGLINFGVGILEIILEFAKILSFGFRLFGNIFAGALLLSIIGALTAVAVPPVLYLFEVFFGIIQAYVFYLLATIFISSATISHHAAEQHE
ncbi:MAG: F0F1 ATP synthase subunit A [Anaerolineales bacterium]